MRWSLARRSVWLRALLVFGLAVPSPRLALASAHDGAPCPCALPSSIAPPRLFLAVDGLSWEAFQFAQSRGLLRQFRHAAPMIAPYPSMSHPAWAEILGTPRVFGARGNMRTVEARWFDLEAMRVADDPRQVIERQAGPYNYMRAFDTYFDPLLEPLMYFPGQRLFTEELADIERDIIAGFTGDQYAAYVSGTDAMAHTHLEALHPFLVQFDRMVTRVLDTLAARGVQPEVWLVSDHGNAGAFAEGDAESYLTPVSLDSAITRAGLVRRDTGTVTGANEVAVVTIALASMVNTYFPDLSRRRRFALEALREPGVTLATWLEVRERERVIVVVGRDKAEAELRWRRMADDSYAYAYTPIRGNPLHLADSLHVTPTAAPWVPDAVMRAATEWEAYPDAPYRLVQSAEKQVANAPDLIVNLADGYAHAGDFGRVVRMVRTHGSLSARATLGVVASHSAPLPTTVRADEVTQVMGVDPHALFPHAHALTASDALTRARQLRRSNAMLPTGRTETSHDAAFLRRARPIVESMGYFTLGAVRELISGWRDTTPADSTAPPTDRVRTSQALVGKADVLLGLGSGVDSWLALADGLDADSLEARLRAAESRLRTVPSLAPLAELRDVWTPHDRVQGERDPGRAAPLRQATMAAWTLPYFLDAALYEPESDSVADPRDAQVAERWFSRDRNRVRREPLRVLEQPSIAATLFHEVFAERRLWRDLEPATPPLLYTPDLSDVTVVLVPGIYGELFDGELWQRGLKAVRDRLGARTVTVTVDGRCSAEYNAPQLLYALRTDTQRRLARGYARPRYLLLGYSKGGVDATHALLADSTLATDQIAALVTIATPHLGSPVAERTPLPSELLSYAVTAPLPAPCDESPSAPTLWPSARAAFWAEHEEALATRVPYFSLSFASDARLAHPFMKITKRIGQFTEPNDGVVALSASRFPASMPAVDLGTIAADHIAGIAASSFPQEAFLEAVVVTLGELGVLAPTGADRWRTAQLGWRRKHAASRRDQTRVPPFATALRVPDPMPGGGTGWTPTITFRMQSMDAFARVRVRPVTRQTHPDGFSVRCDQQDIVGFRREYEFLYDASNGGREGHPHDGVALTAADGSSSGRACQFATQGSAIKMTTIGYRFRPQEFGALEVRLRVLDNVHGVDPGRQRRGANDAAFKLWFVLRDSTTGSTRLFGYTWAAPDRDGRVPADGELLEAAASRRNLWLTRLPEAWLVNVGALDADGAWHAVSRDFAADVQRAFPAVTLETLEVIGITVQSDSDDSRGETRVLLDFLTLRPLR